MSPCSAPGRLLFSRPGVNLVGLLRDQVGDHWNLSSKWLSEDGLCFTLIFTEINSNDAWQTVKGHFVLAKAMECSGKRLNEEGSVMVKSCFPGTFA